MKQARMLAGLLLGAGLLLTADAAPDAELHPERLRDELRFAGVFPPGVKTVSFISPASYPGSPSHLRGLELLKKSGLKVKVLPHAFAKPEPGKKAAALEVRLEDFYSAWNDPETDMILCVRGGRGCRELLAALDWSKLKKRPELYLQGYSDVTQITAAMLAKGYGHPVAGPMSGSMAGLQEESIRAMKAMHHGEQVGPLKLSALVPGDCEGLAFAGLLSRLAWVTDSDYCPSMAGRIVIIEGVSSTPEAVRKDLQTLLDRNFFKGASGVVFGHFLRCGDRAEVEAALKEFAPKVGIPVYRGFPFGHSSQCYAIDFSRRAEIKDGKIIFPAVK